MTYPISRNGIKLRGGNCIGSNGGGICVSVCGVIGLPILSETMFTMKATVKWAISIWSIWQIGCVMRVCLLSNIPVGKRGPEDRAVMMIDRYALCGITRHPPLVGMVKRMPIIVP
jgi:hypothetical protein